jgi:large subunit ribosomal protein L5e
LITQDKTKYNTPKYRFVVRVSNKDVVCQVIHAKVKGDEVVCSAYSHELTNYGMKVGHTNYAACYATGLLLARRLLKKVGLDTRYAGKTETDGSVFLVEQAEDAPRPFKAYLDVGLVRTTTGNRVFGALKGACDGGLYIPHSNQRFPGFNKEDDSYTATVHKERIYGVHVAKYMKELKESNEEEFKARFSQFIANGLTAENIEKKYKELHAAIRKAPDAIKSDKTPPKNQKRFNREKLDLKSRKQRVASKLAKLTEKLKLIQE